MPQVESIAIRENGQLKLARVYEAYATEDLPGNCDFCMGTGKVTVEHLGLKDCPRCNGEGNIESQEQIDPMANPMAPEDPMAPQDPAVPQPPQDVQTPEEPKEPKKPEANPFTESKKKAFEDIINCACNKSVQQFEGYVGRKLKVLSRRKRGNESVGLLFGLPTIEREGKKVKGILAYAGVSLNNRIYLPEELAKGNGLTLPLLLNHSAVDGAEEEMDRLDEEMQDHLNNGKDFKVGEVTLRWEPDELTLYYEGTITHPFFQKEVDDAEMAVSLGIYYDSDSPTVCNQECYTLIKGAEFREVSLVYHPGFPIATIEAVEAKLKKKSSETIATENRSILLNSGGTVYTTNLTPQWFNVTGSAITDSPFQFQLASNEAQLQPGFSLPKFTEEGINLQPEPEIKLPQDTMKEKTKAKEDFEICPECGHHASDLKSHFKTDHGYSSNDAGNLAKKKLKKNS